MRYNPTSTEVMRGAEIRVTLFNWLVPGYDDRHFADGANCEICFLECKWELTEAMLIFVNWILYEIYSVKFESKCTHFPVNKMNLKVSYAKCHFIQASVRNGCMGLLTDTQNCRLRMRREYRERFPRHRATHVPWCMPGSLTSGFLWSRWQEKRSRHSRCMRNPHFCVSGKRPMALACDTRAIT